MSLFSGLIKRIGSLKQLRLIVVFFLISLFVWLSSKMSEIHTAKVDIYFDYSDETFETYRVHEPDQAIEFVISGTGLRLLFITLYFTLRTAQDSDPGSSDKCVGSGRFWQPDAQPTSQRTWARRISETRSTARLQTPCRGTQPCPQCPRWLRPGAFQ